MASFNVREPLSIGKTVAPSSFMRMTFMDWRSTSSAPIKMAQSMLSRAAAVAVATPCCPAPVSAIRCVFPHHFGQKSLAKGVVDFMGSGMQQVLPFQPQAEAQFFRKAGDRT